MKKQKLLSIAITCLFILGIIIPMQAQKNEKPNIILLNMDNFGYGEVGDALEGSLRVPGMIKWPAKIKPAKSNEMVAIHDFYPTLANIIGAKVPTDRAIDGVDQGDFFLGKNKQSARESLITFMEGEVAAVRWKQWRIYPREFVASAGNPSLMGVGAYRAEGMGYPSVYNIARDPRNNGTRLQYLPLCLDRI